MEPGSDLDRHDLGVLLERVEVPAQGPSGEEFIVDAREQGDLARDVAIGPGRDPATSTFSSSLVLMSLLSGIRTNIRSSKSLRSTDPLWSVLNRDDPVLELCRGGGGMPIDWQERQGSAM
jgi:hypothetical protein